MPELPDTAVSAPSTQATRRGLLKTLAVLGPAFLGGGGVAAAVSAPKLAPLNVALLLPERSPYPQFAQAFERGFRQGCAAQEMTLRRYVTGSSPRQAQAAARAALAPMPQVLVTLGDGLGEHLTPVLAQRDVLHLNAEIGVLMARPQHCHPLTLTTSLHAWEAEWALGASLARGGQKEVHLLFSILDSGYDLPYAFTAGLQSAGGQVMGTTLLGEMDTRAEAQRVAQHLRTANVRTVHVVASEGAPALLAALRQAGMRVSASGLGIGVGAPAGTVGALGSPVQLRGAAAQTPQNSPLFALGFDTGTWLSRALEAGTPRLPLAPMAAMSTQKFTGVRGPVAPDLQGHLTAALHQMGGRLGSLQRPLATHPGVIAQTQAPRSGWQNTFLHG